MNNTYPIEYTGDEVVKLLQKIDELTKSMGLEIIDSPDKATKPGIYAIEVEAIVFQSKYRQILIVSQYIEPAMGEETILQTLFDAEHGSIKLRKRANYTWSEWETIGDTDLSDYYTKSQVDTKVANTFKYKGTFISPMVIPKTGFAPGDVYNCAWGDYIPNYFYNSKEITSIVLNEPTATSNLSLTITFSEPIGKTSGAYIESPYRIGLQLEENPTGALVGKVSWNTDGRFEEQTTIIVTPTLQDEGHDEKIPNIRPFNDFMSYILSHTGPFNTTVFNVKEYIGSTGVSNMYVDDGCDVVYTGDAWDSLGSNFNPNNYYTTSQVDNKIKAAITTTLNTEV